MFTNKNNENLDHQDGTEGATYQALDIHLPYPLASSLSALLLILMYLLAKQPHWIEALGIPTFIFHSGMFWLYLAFAGVAIYSDFHNFHQAQASAKHSVKLLEQELRYAWKSKRKLQEKAHIYSDHADKLKRFISDKLLDYIDYDEKFLHFKNIASEVRHNGVISYDIVKSALEQALLKAKKDLAENDIERSNAINFTDTHRFGLPNNPNNEYQQALDAMKYLWDLLDLSTADNIALHVGDELIECEESYYQQELNSDHPYSSSKQKPVFYPAYALVKTLASMLEPLLMEKIIAESLHGQGIQTHQAYTDPENDFYNEALTETCLPIAEQTAPSTTSYENSLVRIQMSPTEHLLGNENHIILLLENLVKNAQFFSSKAPFKQSSDRIGLTLKQYRGYLEFSVYNRGPHIKAGDKNQMFDLGYSTRRAREHHGRGLGLYFVKQVVTGYQGRIEVENIDNETRILELLVKFDNQSVITKNLQISHSGKRPLVMEVNGTNSCDEPTSSLLWTFDDPIDGIDLTTSTHTTPLSFDSRSINETQDVMDPMNPLMPQWRLEIKQKSGVTSLRLYPLDIKGVLFRIKLPSAESTLNGDEPPFEESFDEEVELLDEKFQVQPDV